MVNIVLFFAHACIQWWTRCTAYASTKDQSNGTQRINIQRQNLRTKDQSYGPIYRHVVVNILFYSLHMDQNNGIKCTYKGPMGTQCMYNYRDTRYLCVQRTNPMGN